jgi:hypothetical protein
MNCHPERSVAESKDLQLLLMLIGKGFSLAQTNQFSLNFTDCKNLICAALCQGTSLLVPQTVNDKVGALAPEGIKYLSPQP